jgi:hypothetical protein
MEMQSASVDDSRHPLVTKEITMPRSRSPPLAIAEDSVELC